MIRSYRKMQGAHVNAVDGNIGTLKDIYFDDSSWQVQYFVVELGSWFFGKEVLVPPEVVLPFDGTLLKVSMTKSELKLCTHADSAIPASLQQRYRQRSIFDLAYSSGNQILSGPFIVPPLSNGTLEELSVDPHMKNCNNFIEYMLIAREGEVGTVNELLLDDTCWMIRFIAGSISNNSITSQEKLLDPKIIENIAWSLSSVKINMNVKQVLLQPDFDPGMHLDTSLEILFNEINKIKSKSSID